MLRLLHFSSRKAQHPKPPLFYSTVHIQKSWLSLTSSVVSNCTYQAGPINVVLPTPCGLGTVVCGMGI